MTGRSLSALVFLLTLAAVLALVPFGAWADTGDVLIVGAMATDSAVTEVLRAHGHEELNGWQQNRTAGYAIKLAVGTAAIAYRRHLIRTGHKRAANILTAAVVTVSLAAVTASLRNGSR